MQRTSYLRRVTVSRLDWLIRIRSFGQWHPTSWTKWDLQRSYKLLNGCEVRLSFAWPSHFSCPDGFYSFTLFSRNIRRIFWPINDTRNAFRLNSRALHSDSAQKYVNAAKITVGRKKRDEIVNLMVRMPWHPNPRNFNVIFKWIFSSSSRSSARCSGNICRATGIFWLCDVYEIFVYKVIMSVYQIGDVLSLPLTPGPPQTHTSRKSVNKASELLIHSSRIEMPYNNFPYSTFASAFIR